MNDDLDIIEAGQRGGRLFNPDLHVNTTDPHRRAMFLAHAFALTYPNRQTGRSYLQATLEWLGWLHEVDPDLDPISRNVRRHYVDTYLRTLEQVGRAPATVARKLSALRQWYRYLVSEEYVDRDPTVNIRGPKVSLESNREFLSPRELADFVTAAEKEGGYPWALCATLAFTAVRIGEVCNADIEDLSTERYHRTLRIVRKGGGKDVVPLPMRLVDALERAHRGRDSGPLLLTTVGTRMQREAAGRIVKRFAKIAAPTKHVTPHGIRHSAITMCLVDGADITAAAAFAGHADVRTTQRYDRRARKLDQSRTYNVANAIAGYER